ncbi:MAG: amidophosphoribosyltransferase [Oscillospiraceae bacterium]|nr:amidophosphoribosyltransferase [Oscillospiraceae bacterium]
MSRGLGEECGVFGIYGQGAQDGPELTYLALYALQHRGQQSCGIAVNDDGVINYYRDIGLVPEVFDKERLQRLGAGRMALGHVRYSHSPGNRASAQPLVVRHVKGTMAIAHNGNLTNAAQLREDLEMQGAIFHAGTNAELMSHIIIKERLGSDSIEQALEKAMHRIEGAYSLVIMSPSKLIAARDPIGFRPLCMGEIGGGVVFASETCALDAIGAKFVRDIEPGEIVVVSSEGIRSIRTHMRGVGKLCVFELIYFARPDSVIEGVSVHGARLEAGKLLAREQPAQADVVIGVPDSGLDAALGFSRESGIPYGVGFIKNRYIGRTFIQPGQSQRETSLGIKLNVIADTIKGKRVVLVDDSIVRGTTCGRIVGLIRQAGAAQVHMRISSPPFRHPCYFGTDIDAREKLIANRMSVPEIAEKIGVDSLGYLSVEAAGKIAGDTNISFCDGCFTGDYPLAEPSPEPKSKFEQPISGR